MIISNFIYTKENALPDEMCDRIVDHINEAMEVRREIGDTKTFDDATTDGSSEFPLGHLERNDFQLFQPLYSVFGFNEIQDAIVDGLNEYRSAISSVKTQRNLYSECTKLQYTPKGGGYHVWHIEQGGGLSSTRSLAWLIYLNDVQEGGETEFLYQQMRVKPRKGTLVIFPAGITHPHRGNPPYSNDKYIATGWFYVPHSITLDQVMNTFEQ